MKHCEICTDIIPARVLIDFKYRNLKNRKYCLKCSPFGNHNTKKLKLTHLPDLKNINGICINCTCNFYYNSYVSNGKYCSNKCQQEYLSNRYITKWLNGDVDISKSSLNLSKYIRNYLLKISEYKCSLCGWGEKNVYSNTYPLVIDHIDGNAENSVISNLRVICPNCDSLTCTYKGLNKGNGRHNRKLRYKEGKSY